MRQSRTPSPDGAQQGTCVIVQGVGLQKKVPESHYRCIDDTMTHDDELTASSLKDILIKKFGAENVKYGIRTIARIWNELGWTFTSVRYCQAIRNANKEKRLAWCKQRIDEKECFQDVIFTDESTFQLESHRRKCFRKKKTPRRLKYRHKHPPKIHVWGGISKQGATHLVMFGGIMNATRYGDIYIYMYMILLSIIVCCIRTYICMHVYTV